MEEENQNKPQVKKIEFSDIKDCIIQIPFAVIIAFTVALILMLPIVANFFFIPVIIFIIYFLRLIYTIYQYILGHNSFQLINELKNMNLENRMKMVLYPFYIYVLLILTAFVLDFTLYYFWKIQTYYLDYILIPSIYLVLIVDIGLIFIFRREIIQKLAFSFKAVKKYLKSISSKSSNEN